MGIQLRKRRKKLGGVTVAVSGSVMGSGIAGEVLVSGMEGAGVASAAVTATGAVSVAVTVGAVAVSVAARGAVSSWLSSTIESWRLGLDL
jgi:hypothetical protein